ncbi:hypothetical protein PN36_19730 [Candidatus Thiomargarita nelsonii]|uniref:Bacterial repeat domain-containing protein n=1 Tax=Candidatus Thiomargarita nelsonii TaxID=1003181 RepID=A0A0A6RQM5_9GAMM|nr:hypothetical protein PN36_19730 [Candidatus Thiomargarita nelsonii]
MKTNIGESCIRFMRYLLISLFIFGSSAFADPVNTLIKVKANVGEASGQDTSNSVTSEIDGDVDGTFDPGIIDCLSNGSGTCKETITYDDSNSTPIVRLTATPDANSVFVRWTGGGATVCGGTDPLCSFETVTTSERARFNYAAKFSLEVLGSYSGNNVTSNVGGIDCYEGSGVCEENYPQGDGDQVILTAIPDPNGGVFTGWGDPSLCVEPNPGTGPCTIEMPRWQDMEPDPDPPVAGPTTVAQRAIFDSFQLTVNRNPVPLNPLAPPKNPSYIVTSEPAGGIVCAQDSSWPGDPKHDDGDCNEIYAPGTKVILTATPNAGTTFSGWGGPCSGTGTCTVTMSQNLTVMAIFATDEKKLTVVKDGDGKGLVKDNYEMKCQPDETSCEESYPAGSPVILTAKPTKGSHFIKWFDAFHCNGNDEEEPVCEVKMNNDLEMTATFGLSTLTVNIDNLDEDPNVLVDNRVISAPIGIDCTSSSTQYSGECDDNYNPGTKVKLTAIPVGNHIFTGWSVDSCNVEPKKECTVTAATGLTVTASFAPRTKLEVTLSGSGTGKVTSSPPGISCHNEPPSIPNETSDCKNNYPKNIFVTLTAKATSSWDGLTAKASKFVGWQGTVLGGLCAGQLICEVPMDLANSIIIDAEFEEVNQLTVSVMGAGNVTSVPAGIDCNSGDPADSEGCFEDYDITDPAATVTATPDPSSGAAFTGWSGTASNQCTGSNVCELTMDASYTLRATFHVQNTLTVERIGTGDGRVTSDPAGIQCGTNCDEDFALGTTVTLTATTYAGSLFTGWSEETCQTGTTCVVEMDDHKTVTATFKALDICINDVVIDFGDPHGIWGWLNNKDWDQIHPLSPAHQEIGDIDGTGIDDLILDFSGYGLWTLKNFYTWMHLHSLSVEGMITGDLNGDGRDEAIFDFGPGFPNPWVYYSQWNEIQNPNFPSGMSVESMVAGDIMGDTTKDDVVFNLGAAGIEVWNDHDTWFPIFNPNTPEIMVIGNLTGNVNDELVIDFGDAGIWIRWSAFTWELVHSLTAENMVIANMDRQAVYLLNNDELIVDFGDRYGIWSWRPNTANGWMRLHPLSADSMVVADLNCDGNDDLIIDFGSPNGIWTLMGSPNPLGDATELGFYEPGAKRRWKQLHPLSAEEMATGNIDGVDTPPAPPEDAPSSSAISDAGTAGVSIPAPIANQ